ncbi:DinB family protein [Bremerella sp.]|uniref:DinB family protein n=1 Tax=Bremerella sp. TaxID=2795602 RepID=UPI00391CAC89
MEPTDSQAWIDATAATVASYRRMIDATVEQLSDAELHARPAKGINSVAILLRHLGGNLRSRWTNFLTTDGEKPNRDRDTEFQDWKGDRTELLAHFDAGWHALTSAIEQINPSNINQPIFIRGERHTIPQALTRSITHMTYHVGQISLIARIVHQGDWQWLTIPPGQSQQHNQRTWGSASSRSVFGDPNADDDASP